MHELFLSPDIGDGVAMPDGTSCVENPTYAEMSSAWERMVKTKTSDYTSASVSIDTRLTGGVTGCLRRLTKLRSRPLLLFPLVCESGSRLF